MNEQQAAQQAKEAEERARSVPSGMPLVDALAVLAVLPDDKEARAVVEAHVAQVKAP